MLFTLLSFTTFSQTIPKEVLRDWESHIQDGGKWISNDHTGPYDAWGMTFSWGLARQCMNATLYAIQGGKSIGTIWEYKVYYHPLEKEIVIEQWGSDGSFGKGTIALQKSGITESISTFFNIDGGSFQMKHVQKMEGDTKYSETFILKEDQSWHKGQTYTWKRLNPTDQ